MSKRILLLDTNFSAKPIYDFLLSSGSEVYVVGGNPNDSLAKSVQNYVNLNYSDINAVVSLIKKLNIDFLVPGGNDFSYKVCSEVNQEIPFFNIDTVENNDIINNKEKFRKHTTAINLHVPKLFNSTEEIHFPIIVKPPDAYSGHGMTVILDKNEVELNEAIVKAKHYSKTQNYLIEEYVQGQLYSHSAFVVGGEIMIDFFVEEHCVVNKYVVDTSRVIYDFNESIKKQIQDDITLLANSLGLVDGLIHTQFICDGKSFWLIEITRRCPGDLYSKLIEFSTGFPYAEFYARPFINEIKQVQKFPLTNELVFRHTITSNEKMFFNSIEFNQEVKIIKYVPLSLTGDEIKESPFSRIGILFAKEDSESDFRELYKKTISRELYSLS